MGRILSSSMIDKLKQKNMWMYWCGCIGKRTHDLPLAIQCWFAERFAAMTAGWYQPKSGWMIELTKLSKPKKNVQRGAKTWQNSMARSSRISGDANSIIKLIQIGLLAGGFRHFLFSIIYGIILPID